jgi:GNAT superfamily N-acetyltransferase
LIQLSNVAGLQNPTVVDGLQWQNLPIVSGEVQVRRAGAIDAEAIALAHADSIRSIGPGFYSPDVVHAWSSGLTPDLYRRAMDGGEAFFIAIGELDGERVVLGFATHRVDDDQDGASVYVRGRAARRGIGTALLRLAEDHARAHGATTIQIQASLAGVEFYKANGFEELGRGEARLMSGHSMPCVFMRKVLPERTRLQN